MVLVHPLDVGWWAIAASIHSDEYPVYTGIRTGLAHDECQNFLHIDQCTRGVIFYIVENFTFISTGMEFAAYYGWQLETKSFVVLVLPV